MYGLASRESLSKRQSRWVREADETVRSNPAQNVLNREIPSNPIRDKPSIITAMTTVQNQLNSSNQVMPATDRERSSNKIFNSHLMGLVPDGIPHDIETLQSLYEEVRQKCTKLELECESLRNSLRSDLVTRVEKLEQSNCESQSKIKSSDLDNTRKIDDMQTFIDTRIQKLESFSTGLTCRIDSLERSLSELSSRSAVHSVASKLSLRPADNSSEFSALTEPDLSRKEKHHSQSNTFEFLPYFIKEDYAGRDNITKLTAEHLYMVVEILGFYSETPIIYPFGTETQLPKFAQCELDMTFTDADNKINGVAYGMLKRDNKGLYSIQITELNSDGNASGIDRYTLPLVFKCDTDLILE